MTIEQGFCPRCGRPNCTAHPQKGTPVVDFQPSRPLEHSDDPHWVLKRDFANIIKKFTDKGDHETAAVYQNYLDNNIPGGNPTTLF